MTNNDEPLSDNLSDSFETHNISRVSTNSSKWYRLIPLCIRKFLMKQSRYLNKQTGRLDENNESRYPGSSPESDPNPDDSTLYSMVHQNDEEVAMIRATAQMGR